MNKITTKLRKISAVKLVEYSFSRKCSNISKRHFTKDLYDVKRGNFNTLNSNDVNYFKELLGDNKILTSNLDKYNEDWYGYGKGQSELLLQPTTTEEVSKILSYANNNLLAICPQGGNTAVVASSIPVFDEIILSMEKMNKINKIDQLSGVLECEAGCVLENLNNAVSEKGLIMPLDLGAKGNCQIGGNLSTNAGGLRYLRYGSLHGNVLGIEVVQTDGKILDLMRPLKKNNTGYHLKHIFIGSEGTLGIITKIAIQCFPKPKSQNVAFLGLETYEHVLKTYKKAKTVLGETLSAVEVMDKESISLIKEKLGLGSPIGDYPFYLLIENSGSNEKHDAEKLNEFLISAMTEKLVSNGISASEPSKIMNLWQIRERIPTAFRLDGFVFNYDFSLPVEYFYTLTDMIRKYMGSKSHRVFGFGHLGDSNLHLQISVNKINNEIKNMLEPFVFEKVLEFNGSISAEHGIGFLKAKYLNMANDPTAVKLMQTLKTTMDPNGILNPYKVFV